MQEPYCVCSSVPTSPSQTITSRTINRWCAQIPYYETYNHYVALRNPTASTISTNRFLDMTVQVAIDDARLVLKRIQWIELKYPNVPWKSLWGSCVDYFDGISCSHLAWS
uniref:Uncharacterized protein n=1 Tax=Lactuca sativa TaxID=4236 RepID=A0A9R1XSR0_LACSA|nr:hypothetical protein LSAT_V11C200098270 [Lactuca sativa]